MNYPGDVPRTADDQMQATASCVERWAARLAASPDPAPDVAEAVVTGACGVAIASLQEMSEQESPEEGGSGNISVAYWRGRALFITVQTRAGNCYPDA
jgi:hypothetical protein